MDHAVIRKSDIPKLAGGGRFFAPARVAGQGYCELVENPGEIVYDFANVRVPLKQVFLPQTEVLCTYDFDQVTEAPLPDQAILVFGCRPCDARAMAQLDAVFGPENKGWVDPYFLKRREQAVVIPLACSSPCPTCFCTAMGGGPSGTEGADLLARKLPPSAGGAGDAILLEAVTDKGRALLEARREQLVEADPKVLAEARLDDAAAEASVRQANELGVNLGADLSALKKNMDPLFDDGRWEELTASCIGCGSCTYLCPTCHCFDIADESRLYKGQRIRTWDSCQFPLFTKHASGHNPRKNKKERLRQRFMHKFSYAVENSGAALCVGCGRCITGCPVNLDIRDVIRSFAEETKREIAS
jgi:formate hydrogenlyase subunit 6/NADH:ubiquinone oxidoreductase subunit I